MSASSPAPSPSLDFDHPPSDPIALAREWFAASERTGLPNPNSMTLATVDAVGRPSARIVLLRGFDERGAVFYTNRRSIKGKALDATHRAALLFHWDPLERQLRIDGSVTHTSDVESDAYFAGRPRESQINAWASDQSEPVRDRAALLARRDEILARFDGSEVPRPPHWGGYRVSLERVEFWQGDPHRLHDRIVYVRTGDEGWSARRLCP